ncbi:hypothetical protein JG687_00013571 [Phytophthora cactorum]|uniref:Uncharacterized protein n=1 Tax=Phytophthora cactorum TaxID=29920 RepID=A0A8T1TYW6_9STRA|nr:hypothetical protein JG687_00013571 [Phytophthora cactorum]
MSHLGSVHPTHGEEYEQFHRQNLTSLEVVGFADETTTNMYDWLRWIVERNLPLSEVENPLTRQLVRLRPTSATTMKTYMERVAGRVGNTIAKEMDIFFWNHAGWLVLGHVPLRRRGRSVRRQRGYAGSRPSGGLCKRGASAGEETSEGSTYHG